MNQHQVVSSAPNCLARRDLNAPPRAFTTVGQLLSHRPYTAHGHLPFWESRATKRLRECSNIIQISIRSQTHFHKGPVALKSSKATPYSSFGGRDLIYLIMNDDFMGFSLLFWFYVLFYPSFILGKLRNQTSYCECSKTILN